MTSKIATKVGRSVLGKQGEQFAPKDPFYEEYTTSKGKKKRRMRDMPAGLTKQETKILKKVRRRAHYLDKGFSIAGFRFGWTAVIGLIPLAGDVADAGLGYSLVISQCRKCDIPPLLLERMLFNQAVSTGIGFVPLVGDVLLAVWKVNSRNAALLEDFLIARAKKRLASGSDPADAASSPTTRDNTTAGGATKADDPQLSKAEQEKLLTDSKKKDYIDRRTGEKAGPMTAETEGAEDVGGAAYGGDAGPSTTTGRQGTEMSEAGTGTGTGTQRKKSWFRRGSSRAPAASTDGGASAASAQAGAPAARASK